MSRHPSPNPHRRHQPTDPGRAPCTTHRVRQMRRRQHRTQGGGQVNCLDCADAVDAAGGTARPHRVLHYLRHGRTVASRNETLTAASRSQLLSTGPLRTATNSYQDRSTRTSWAHCQAAITVGRALVVIASRITCSISAGSTPASSALRTLERTAPWDWLATAIPSLTSRVVRTSSGPAMSNALASPSSLLLPMGTGNGSRRRRREGSPPCAQSLRNDPHCLRLARMLDRAWTEDRAHPVTPWGAEPR